MLHLSICKIFEKNYASPDPWQLSIQGVLIQSPPRQLLSNQEASTGFLSNHEMLILGKGAHSIISYSSPPHHSHKREAVVLFRM